MKVKGKLLQLNLYMLTKLQKNNFGKIKNLPHRGLNPHQLRIPYSAPIIILPLPLKHHRYAAFLKIVDKNSLEINISNF